MKNFKIIEGCQELSPQEVINVNGGESFAYWVGYAFGSLVKSVQNAIENPSNLPSATVYK